MMTVHHVFEQIILPVSFKKCRKYSNIIRLLLFTQFLKSPEVSWYENSNKNSTCLQQISLVSDLIWWKVKCFP